MNQIKVHRKKRAAHFLLIPELLYSPPNEALIRSYLANNYIVDIYAPGILPKKTMYGQYVETYITSYNWRWIIRNCLNLKWSQYSLFSGTSEDPLVIVGILGFLFRKRMISLVDEIKSDNYRGDRSEIWKEISKWAIRSSKIRIVNDKSRVPLLRSYAALSSDESTFILPGCYSDRPEQSNNKREEIRREWGFSNVDFIVGSSGGFNMTAGADWLISAIRDLTEIKAVIQPLGVTDLSIFLLKSLSFSNRIFIQERRLGWKEAWVSAQGLDAGICVYTNQAAQFQNMGVSSNRLCMFLAMGVPVIASRQKSFEFLETYECGLMVSNYHEFLKAIKQIRNNRNQMSENCETCFREYIKPGESYDSLCSHIKSLTQ